MRGGGGVAKGSGGGAARPSPSAARHRRGRAGAAAAVAAGSFRAVPSRAGPAVAMAPGAGPALAALLGTVLAVLSRAEPAAGESRGNGRRGPGGGGGAAGGGWGPPGVPSMSPRCPQGSSGLAAVVAARCWGGCEGCAENPAEIFKKQQQKKSNFLHAICPVCPKKERRAQAVPGVQLGSAGRQEGEWLDFGARQNPRFISSSSRASVLAAPGSSCCTVPARALPLPRGFVAPCWGFPPLLEERWL